MSLRREIEGLLQHNGGAGVPLNKALKVVGQDPLPKGAEYGPNAVTLTSGTLDGWDLGGRALRVRGRASAVNVYSRWKPGINPQFPIDVMEDGDLEWGEQLEFAGPFGKQDKPLAAIYTRFSGSGAGFRAGKIRMLRRSRFEGFPSDHMKVTGVKGGAQLIEECYFGPQWATPGSKAHADVFTTVAALGQVVIRRCLIDWTTAGRPAGLNNIFRIVRNTNTDYPVREIRIEENLCYFGPSKGFPIQVMAKGPGFEGPVEFINNWLAPRGGGKKGPEYFHPSTNGGVAVWSGNRDSYSGAAIPGPAGARGG